MNQENNSTNSYVNEAEDRTFLEKLKASMGAGAMVECHADEAILAGAFLEDALTEEDAMESQSDMEIFDRELSGGLDE